MSEMKKGRFQISFAQVVFSELIQIYDFIIILQRNITISATTLNEVTSSILFVDVDDEQRMTGEREVITSQQCLTLLWPGSTPPLALACLWSALLRPWSPHSDHPAPDTCPLNTGHHLLITGGGQPSSDNKHKKLIQWMKEIFLTLKAIASEILSFNFIHEFQ